MLESVLNLIDKMYLVIVYSPQFKSFECIKRCVYTRVYCLAVKSNRCRGKVNSIVDFLDFQPSPLTQAQLFNRNQSFLVPIFGLFQSLPWACTLSRVI